MNSTLKGVSQQVSRFPFKTPSLLKSEYGAFFWQCGRGGNSWHVSQLSAACGIHEGKAPILDVPNLLGLERGGHISQELPRQD